MGTFIVTGEKTTGASAGGGLKIRRRLKICPTGLGGLRELKY
jgi:hypothetical protein